MLQLYNTLARRKEPFTPLRDGDASIYSCGPTVYRDVHIGNLRTYLLADWLRRVLEQDGSRVRHVKNITDVGHMRQELLERGEDKVVAAALAAGKTPEQIAHEYTESFMRDELALGIHSAHVFPKATEHVDEMIALIERLIERGLAYEVSGNIYYNAAAFESYGALSGNTGESLLEGVRSEADPQKRDPRDFALWKAAEEGRVMKWPSPWGDGFPGWHIECSAMSIKHLGEEFDIHTGGVDNIFPHHEDERAQSEGALGKQVVRYWVHGQHLLVDGLKMAKSTGNVYTLRDLQSRGFEPMAFRYLCATAHYRHRLNFTFEALRAAALGLNRLRQEAFIAAQSRSENGASGEQWEQSFKEAIHDDLHLPRALAVVWKMVRSDTPACVKARLFERFDRVLGFDLFGSMVELPDALRVMVHEREHLRQRHAYAEADRLRERIAGAGFHVRDTASDPAVVPLLAGPPETLEGVRSSSDVPSFLAKPDALDFSVVLVGRDDKEPLERTAGAVLRHASDKTEVIVVDNGSTDGTGDWLDGLARRDNRVRALRSDHNIGIGAARNCGLLAARGRYVVLVDTSVEFTGDVLSALARALDDESTGVAGAFGVQSDNIRDFEDAAGPEVDAVEGYLMAFRRERIREIGLMDEKFRFYRHLDLDYSFAFRDKGYRNRIVPDVPVRRHAHTDWERTPPEERDRLSKRNFYRFLHKYGHREDLLLRNGSAT
jgi:cysteinyl-tRNA synthetase